MSKIIFPVNIVRDYSSKPNFRGNPTIPNSSKHTLSNDLVLAEKIKEPFSFWLIVPEMHRVVSFKPAGPRPRRIEQGGDKASCQDWRPFQRGRDMKRVGRGCHRGRGEVFVGAGPIEAAQKAHAEDGLREQIVKTQNFTFTFLIQATYGTGTQLNGQKRANLRFYSIDDLILILSCLMYI